MNKSVLILCLLFTKEAINFNYKHFVIKLGFSDVIDMKLTVKEAWVSVCPSIWTENSENFSIC
jgi:hypothetical protein